MYIRILYISTIIIIAIVISCLYYRAPVHIRALASLCSAWFQELGSGSKTPLPLYRCP